MKKIIKTLLLLVCVCTSYLSYGQPGFDDDVQDAPIDGGISVLVAAGVGYGVRAMIKKGKLREK